MAEVREGLQERQSDPPRWEATGEIDGKEGGRPVGFSGSEYQRSGEGMAGRQGKDGNTQVKARPTFRRYTRQYKLQVLKDTDTLGEGEVGAYLRREGLYYSTLRMFREHRTRGLLDENVEVKRGGAAGSSSARALTKGGSREKATGASGAGTGAAITAETLRRMTELEKENRKLQHRVRQTEALLELQKKASELLGISLEGLRLSEE